MSGLLLLALLGAAPGLPAPHPLVEGRAGSPVQVVIYEDLACSDCAAFRRMLDTKLLPLYGEKVAFVHHDFPLTSHPWARKAAIAGRFFASLNPALDVEWRRYIMAAIPKTTESNFEETLSGFARRHGVKATEAMSALSDKRYAELVEKDFQEGVARGVSRTPTVFVNGQPFIESFTFDEISKGIEAALAEH